MGEDLQHMQQTLASSPEPADRDQSAAGTAPDAPGRSRLLPTQERIWFLAQLHEGSPVHNLPLRFRLRGELDGALLECALRFLIERHSILRTRFAARDGVPWLHVHTPAESDLDLRVVDFGPDAVEGEARRPFDLSQGPLLRAVVFRRDESDHELLLVTHKIVCDGHSAALLLQELGSCYSALRRGERPVLPAIPEIEIGTSLQQESLDYWKKALQGAPVLELPGDRPRPETRTLRGGEVRFAFSPHATAVFERFLNERALSLSAGLMAIFQVLLFRYSGQDQVCTGFAVPGPLANTLVIRSDLSSNPRFGDFAADVQRALAEACRHDVPFERIVEAVHPKRSQSHTSLFQAMLEQRPAEWNRFSLAGLDVTPLNIHTGASEFDLSLTFWQAGPVIEGALEYSSDLFDAGTVERVAGHLHTLVESVADDRPVATLPLLAPAEARKLLVEWNDTARPCPQACVHELIAAQCRRTPDRVAVSCGERNITYAELDGRANSLAHELRERGVGPGDLAGVCVERSIDMVTAVLGVLKAGAAYVPLDPAYPAERLEYMLQHSGARVLIAQHSFRQNIASPDTHLVSIEDAGCRSCPNPPEPARAGDLAYVIYTSGSTGRPKGVAVRHAGLTNFIESMRVEPGFSDSDVLLAVTTLSFDIAGLELYLPLVAGGRVVIATRDEARDGERLMRLLDSEGITVLQATPATWPMLIEAGWKGHRRMKVLCGGEAMPKGLSAQLLMRAGSVWNMYGPTETTVWSSVYRVRGDERSIPVGKPIANTQFYIFDRWDQPVPAGVPGELLIGGHGLAAGYLHDPEKTAARFVDNPLVGAPGERLYRTGDLARYLPDGNVELLGRMDNQVKVRGFRIELGEIEAALAAHPGVRNAAVTLQENDKGEKELAGFVTAARGSQLAESDLRALLKQKLPEYMIPASIEFLDQMPQTPNGKIDRKALPRIERSAPQTIAGGACDITELRLFRIWTDVLGVRPSGAEQSFFDLGGHSLLAARMVALIEQEFGRRLSMAAIFNGPTIKQQAAMLRAEGDTPWPRMVVVQPEGSKAPFYWVGGGANFLTPLARRLHELGLNRPFLSLAHPRAEDLPKPGRLEDLAAYHVETLLQLQPQGPYVLGGFCAEGAVAYDMAQQLKARGERVAWLGMFETENRTDRRMAREFKTLVYSFAPTSTRLRAILREGPLHYARRRATLAWRLLANTFRPRMVAESGLNFLFDFSRLDLYRPALYDGTVHLFRRPLDEQYYPDPNLGWRDLITDLVVYEIVGTHLSLFREPAVDVMAGHVMDGILAAESTETRMAAGGA